MPRESRILLTVLTAGLSALTGCSNSGSSDAPPTLTDEFVVVSMKPTSGSASVGPTADVSVTFSRPVDEIPALALTVSDGLASLAGTLASTPDGVTWTWTPDVQMPRGANITARLSSGIRSRTGVRLATDSATTFSVREVITEASYQVAGGTGTVMIWPNGRRAVGFGLPCFEVVFGSLVQRPFVIKADDIAYGDGSFLTREFIPGGVGLARRNLVGSEQVIALPSQFIQVTGVNTSGDAVLALRVQAQIPTPWQLYRLPLGAQIIEPLGATAASETSSFVPVIAEDGAILVGYRDATTDRPAIMRIAADSTIPEIYLADEEEAVGDVLCGVAADGVATLVWLSGTSTLRAATLAPGGPLVQLQDDLQLNGPAGSVSLDFKVARSGSAVVEISTRIGSPTFVNFEDIIRLERTGWVGFPERYGNSKPAKVEFNYSNGEWWVVREGPALGTLERLRSRPNEMLGEPALIYEAALAGQFLLSFNYGFDDYGRAIVALMQAYPIVQSSVIVLE